MLFRSLAHMLVTDLSNTEIVLGKLAARLVPVFGMVASGLPVLFLGALLGGIDPRALIAAFLITLAVGLLGCALALAFSVWGSKTHEVLLATYLLISAWLLAAPTWDGLARMGGMGLLAPGAPQWLWTANPFWVAFAPYLRPMTSHLTDCLVFLGAAVLVSALLLVLSVLCVRSTYVRQMSKLPRGERRLGKWLQRLRSPAWLPSPSLDGNPVLWREWHRARPSRWSRVVWLIYGGACAVFSFWAIWVALESGRSWGGRDFGIFVNGFQAGVGLLLLSVSAATSLAEERTRGSLDVVLATPLSTRAIVWGKWWGAFRTAPKLVVLPALVALALAVHSSEARWLGVPLLVGLILAYGAAITSLGLALATWISRFGRAVAVSVGAYVIVTVGWFFLIVTLSRANHFWGPGLAAASPFWGTIYLTVGVAERGGGGGEWEHFLAWGTFWTVAYAAVAVALFTATLSSFDRCLGRIPDSPPTLFLRRRPSVEHRYGSVGITRGVNPGNTQQRKRQRL